MKKRWNARLTACTVAAVVLLGSAGYLQARAYAAEAGEPGTPPPASSSANGGAAATDTEAKGHHPGGHRGGKAMFGFDALQTAADALGMEKNALRTELESGKTLAQIAEAKGMKRDDLIAKLQDAVAKRLDERVAAGELSEEQAAAIKAKAGEHMAAAVDSNRLGMFIGRGGHGHGIGRFAHLDEIAEVLGMTEDALRTELRNGKSLAEIAAAKGIGEEQLIAKLKESMTDELREFVRAKRPAAKTSSAGAAAAEGASAGASA